jgi:two-component system response regulator YesN
MRDCVLKVLLVDDEENVRNLLKTCMNWEEIGLSVAGEASSGREALDILGEINPDIIITDIRMPSMDGLEFARIAAESCPQAKIIILTAYEEFEYAKKSIKIGIADFLLKPVKRADLRNALLALSRKIQDEKVGKEEYARLKERLAENFPYLKERFLYDLLHRSRPAHELMDRLVYFSAEGLLRHAQVALISPSPAAADRNMPEEENALLDMACMDIVRSYFENNAGVNILSDFIQGIVVLNSDPSVDILYACEQIKALIIHKLGCDVCIGIGNACDDFKSIAGSYKEACDALNYRVVYGKNQVICFNDITINNSNPDYRSDEIGELGFYVKAGFGENASEIIEKIFDGLIAAKSIHIDQIRVISVNIVTAVLNSISELGMGFEDIFSSKSLPYSYVLKIETIPEMKDYLKRLAASVTKAVNSARARKSNRVLGEIIDYIGTHISDPGLSLSGVAKAFYLNSSYLSRVFKQETGQTFVEHLTKTRIEKALELLNETDLKAYEIGDRIGIPDPNYFGKCFKKCTGMSVNDYKKTLDSRAVPVQVK